MEKDRNRIRKDNGRNEKGAKKVKRKKMRLSFCKGDVLAIGFVLLLALVTEGSFLGGLADKKAQTAVICQNGRIVKEISLQSEDEVWIEGEYVNHIVVRDGAVAIVESDCPGEDCVHSGWISQAGRNIVCLPNRVEIRIRGEAEVDFILH